MAKEGAVNPDLSICIPTYNRSGLLETTLAELVPRAARCRLPVCVSDNASTDRTGEVVARYVRSYGNVQYRRNPTNLGFDRNVRAALAMAPTRFAWLHADDDRIVEGGLEKVLAAVAPGCYEMVVVNGGGYGRDGALVGRVRGIGSKAYRDRNDLLGDLGWHMTWITSLVFGEKVRRGGNFEKYFGTGFVHLGTAFDYLGDKDAAVYWESEPLVGGAREAKGTAAWYAETVRLWSETWYALIRSLPAGYSEEARSRCIKAHGVMTGLFDVGNLLELRARGHFDRSIFRKYRPYLPEVADTPEIGFLMAAVLPERLARVKIVRSLVKRLTETASLAGLRGFRD